MTSLTPEPKRLPWYDLAIGVWAHTERAFYPPGFKFPLHCHDYGEMFFVERGVGVHRLRARSDLVHPGDLVFIHPDVEHALEATATKPLVFINMAIPRRLFRDLEARFAPSEHWVWSSQDARPISLSAHDQGRLLPRIVELEAAHFCRDRLQVESLLLEAMWHATATMQQRPSLPAQLSRLLRDLADPDNLRSGVSGMAQRVQWSREHLNRQIRKHFGETAVSLLNRHRLDHAARLLRHGEMEVLEVCQACGLDNLSHFYRLFRRRFGCAPGALRQQRSSGAV